MLAANAHVRSFS